MFLASPIARQRSFLSLSLYHLHTSSSIFLQSFPYPPPPPPYPTPPSFFHRSSSPPPQVPLYHISVLFFILAHHNPFIGISNLPSFIFFLYKPISDDFISHVHGNYPSRLSLNLIKLVMHWVLFLAYFCWDLILRFLRFQCIGKWIPVIGRSVIIKDDHIALCLGRIMRIESL